MPPQTMRRRDFRLPAKKATVNGGRLEGTVLNVARSGIAIETDLPIRIGSSYRLHVVLGDEGFTATGTARWCTLRSTRRNDEGEVAAVYHAGFALEGDDGTDPEAVLAQLRSRLLESPEE